LGSSGQLFAKTVQRYEGEAATRSATGAGTATVSSTSVASLTTTGGSLTFTVNAPVSMKAGQTCDVAVRGAGSNTNSKTITLKANGATAAGNGVSAGTVAFTSITLATPVTQVNLKPGVNTIVVTTNAATAYIDYIEITFLDDVPVTPNASKNAKKLYSFLLNNYQKKTVSGAMENNIWNNDENAWFENIEDLEEIAYIKEKSDKYPVLLGGDFMHYTGWDADVDENTWFKGHGATTVDLAIQVWEKGGIPAANWHWRNPLKKDPGKGEFYSNVGSHSSDGTDFSLKKAFTNTSYTTWDENSDEYKAIIEDIDNLSNLLKKLRDLDVPLLWRPVHEPNGNFFWWGGTYTNSAVAAYVKLYQLMYDRMVNVHGLTNLIWVWNLNYSGVNNTIYNNYYPGDEYVDIVSWDTYQARSNYATNYTNLKTWSGSGKIIAMAECGASPLPADMTGATKQYWSYFMPWYGDYTMGSNNNTQTTAASWNTIMNHDYVFSLDEMPGWDWDIYEAEDATITLTKEGGTAGVITPLLKASGNAYLDMKDCNLRFDHVYVDKAETYDLKIRYSLPANYDGDNEIGARTQNLVVNGASTAVHFIRTSAANDFAVIETSVSLHEGDNIVALNNSWGWVNIDYIAIKTGNGLIPTPSKPKDLSKVSTTKNSIEVSWTASTGGVGAISYNLYLDGELAENTSNVSYIFTELDPETEYTIEVEAEDAAGTKSGKAAIAISTEPAVPRTPANISKVFADKSSITVSWSASTGGEGAISYNVYLNGSLIGNVSTTSYTFTELDPETEYTIEVEAIDASETTSLGKAIIKIFTESTTPKTPSELNKVSASKNSITVSWTASTGGEGAISYNVYLNGSLVDNVSATSYTFTELDPETEYTIGIEAVDEGGVKSAIASVQLSTNSATRYEAEDAAFSDGGDSPPIIQDAAVASGGKWVDTREGTVTFTVDVATAGSYDLLVYYNLYDRGTKEQNLAINGASLGAVFFPATETGVEVLPNPIKIKLNAGDNTIAFSKSWGWVILDYIEITEHINVKFDLNYNPANPNATEGAKKLYTFLLDNYQKKIISGVMTGENINGKTSINDTGLAELNNVNNYSHSNADYRSITALIGLDYRDATGRAPNLNWKNAVTNLAKDTWDKGGIPALCWHWRNPLKNNGGRANECYTQSGNSNNYTTFDLRDAFTDNTYDTWDTNSGEYKGLIEDMKDIADELQILQDAGVAILWRPLHEASGGWFWWGRDREAKPCVQLYRLMYDYMVNTRELNNLIWVWNSDANDDSWYPGDEYVDIIGRDNYAKDHGSLSALFEGTKSWSQAKKIITLSENGPVPFPANLKADEAYWSYFMTWNGQYVSNTGSSGDTYYGNGQTSWRTVMTDPYTIRLTAAATNPPLPGMPGWSNYAKTALATPVLSGNATNNSITISWPKSTGGVTDESIAGGYYVYLNGIQVAKLEASESPTYTFSGLLAETAYTIAVEAYDEDALTIRRSNKGGFAITTNIVTEIKKVDAKNERNINIYPNPVSQFQSINVEINTAKELLKDTVIEIYNSLGARISSTKATGKLTVVKSPATDGIYLLIVKNKTGIIQTQKLVVK
jgi:mannan endo-1,4-beta-mannosidase